MIISREGLANHIKRAAYRLTGDGLRRRIVIIRNGVIHVNINDVIVTCGCKGSDYCDKTYHTPPSINPPPQLPTFNSLMEKIERVQYQAALPVTGAWKVSSCSKLNEELGWETLSDRRMGRRILQIHKITNNKTPSYLKDKLPPYHRPFFNRPLFNVFCEIKFRTDR